MRIKRVDVTGFKSFCEQVSLAFPPGISAIVGPNGCGKSNVVDAIRWAMGEQSARLLRGREPLHDQDQATRGGIGADRAEGEALLLQEPLGRRREVPEGIGEEDGRDLLRPDLQEEFLGLLAGPGRCWHRGPG